MLRDLDTERLTLRRWRASDRDPFVRINLEPTVTRYLRGRPETPDETDAVIARINEHWNSWGFGLWAVEHRSDERFIGFIGLSHHRWFPDEVEIGWRLDPAYWGRGLATEGARAALEFGFRDLDLPRVISIIHRHNLASIRVAEKLGLHFWREGEFPHPDHKGTMPIVVYLIERSAEGMDRRDKGASSQAKTLDRRDDPTN